MVNLHSLSKENMPDQGLCLDIFCKMNKFNCFPVYDKANNPIALGLFLGASALQISCAPTAKYYSIGKTLVIRAIGKAANFSDLTIRTAFHGGEMLPFVTTKMRQKTLKMHLELESYNCNCTLCENTTLDQMKSSIKCPSCKEGCVPTATKICVDCNQEIDQSLLKKYPVLLYLSTGKLLLKL